MTVTAKEARQGLDDILSGLSRWRLWTLLSYYDFVGTYRRSVIGPMWQIAQVCAWIGGLWLVFGSSRGSTTLRYIGIGVVTLGLIQTNVTGSTRVLSSSSSLILNVPNPVSIFVFRLVSLNLLRWSIQLPIVFLLMLAFSVPLSPVLLLAIPGIVILLLAVSGAALTFSVLGARYEDIRFAVDASMRLLFFMTPVFWEARDQPLRMLVSEWNPGTYLLRVVREPLMGEIPGMLDYQVAIATAFISLVVGAAVFSYARNRIVYWV